MEDRPVAPPAHRAGHRGVAHVHGMDLHPVADGGEVGVLDLRIVEIVEIVQHAHPVAGGKQGFDQV